MLITNPSAKKRTNSINEIESVYVEEGVFSKKFTKQLVDFIAFILGRYSGEKGFPDDLVHFAYLRIMERLGAIKSEKPKVIFPERTEEDVEKNRQALEDWMNSGKCCLFDATRSNLGNYIFSITRHAHSNYMYHNAKKFKELEPPATELPEPEVSYDYNEENTARVLCHIEVDKTSELPLSLRRYLLWKQSA